VKHLSKTQHIRGDVRYFLIGPLVFQAVHDGVCWTFYGQMGNTVVLSTSAQAGILPRWPSEFLENTRRTS